MVKKEIVADEEIPKITDNELEKLDEFDLEALIVEGKEAIIKRGIEFFDTTEQKIKQMPVYLKPLSHSEWESLARLTGKKSKKSIEQLVCAKGLVEPDGMEIPISTIRRMQKGAVSSIYEEIKIISGQTKDRFEEQFIEKMTDF